MAEKKTDAEHPKAAAVRKAASNLSDAVVAARKAGFAVTWPNRIDDIAAIQIAETGSVVADGAEPAETLTGTKVETQPVTAG